MRSRRRVIDAAVDLLVEGGLGAVTVEDVVARSGVAKTTVYRHWRSRDELVADILTSALPAPVEPDTGSLEGDLRRLARGLAAGLSDPRSAALLAAIALPSGDRTLDSVRRDATNARHRALHEVVHRARRRGEALPPDGAAGIIRSIVGPLFYRRFVEGAAPTAAMADLCVRRAFAPVARSAHDDPQGANP